MSLIIIDKKIPKEAKIKLSDFGDLLELETDKITYDAISGHPDIFFSILNNDIIVAPNLPQKFRDELKKHGISYHLGEQTVGQKYPESSIYNIVSTSQFLIHNLKYTDFAVKDLAMGLDQIHVEQAYTRCNLIALKNDRFITSDKGIEKALKKRSLEVFYSNPDGIILPGFKNGFIGGCAGILGNQLFLLGSVNHYPAGDQLRDQIDAWGYEVVEFYDGPLFDGGSVLFL
ncbi:MAG: hypothetical protein KKG99_15090 [Bacteroidetes bacterium]|nr:hypothetical protein [Bacteroidota bacterium]